MQLNLQILVLLLSFCLVFGQENLIDETAEELGIEPGLLLVLVGIGAFVLLVCGILICLCCCHQCRDPTSRGLSFAEDDKTEDHTATFDSSTPPATERTIPSKFLAPNTANARQVSFGDLPNDISANEKKHKSQAIGNLALTGTPIGGTSKNRTSVKLAAAQGGFAPILPAQGTTYTEPTEGELRQSTEPKSKEEIRKKVERMAQGAAAGVYSTGSSTARLSVDIVRGFSVMREKKKDKAERQALDHLESLGESGKVEKQDKPKEQPSYTKVPEGKARLDQFLNDEDDDMF